MEFLNRIELCGIIGNASINSISDKKIARFSLLTETAFKNSEAAVVDCTWFNCTAWEGEKIKNLDKVEKGKWARITGRVRTSRFTDSNGVDRVIWEVLCHTLEVTEGQST